MLAHPGDIGIGQVPRRLLSEEKATHYGVGSEIIDTVIGGACKEEWHSSLARNGSVSQEGLVEAGHRDVI